MLDIRDALAANDEQCRGLKASVEDTGAVARLDEEMRKIQNLVVSAVDQRAHAESEMKEIRTLIEDAVLTRQEAEMRVVRTCIDDAMQTQQETELKEVHTLVDDAIR